MHIPFLIFFHFPYIKRTPGAASPSLTRFYIGSVYKSRYIIFFDGGLYIDLSTRFSALSCAYTIVISNFRLNRWSVSCLLSRGIGGTYVRVMSSCCPCILRCRYRRRRLWAGSKMFQMPEYGWVNASEF